MWPFSSPQVGLDIGSRTIKALKLKKRGGKVSLDRYAFYDLAEGNTQFPSVNSLHESLKAIVEVNGLDGHRVVSCLNDGDVAVFDLTLPKMPEADLAAAIQGEVEQLISFPIEEASLAHTVLGTRKNGRDEMLLIKAYCVRHDDVKKVAELLESANLRPEALEYSMLSNISMLSFNEYLGDEGYTIVIDLGESKTTVALVQGKKLVATASIAISFGSINAALQTANGITYHDAEGIKSRVTLKSNSGDSSSQEIVENVYVELFQELQRTVEFFQLKTDDQPIGKIFVIGGGSQYPSVLQAIKASCHIETIAANPFRNIDIFSADERQNEKIAHLAPYMATAVGLALRRLDAS